MLLLILTILIAIAIIVLAYLFYIKHYKSSSGSDLEVEEGQMSNIDDFVKELNKFIDEYNKKYCADLKHVNKNMANVKALFELAKKYKFKTAHEVLYRVTNFRIDNCASDCMNAADCNGCCDQKCDGASDRANCKMHCQNINCSKTCDGADNYSDCRMCCEKLCNINDYESQMECIKMCDSNFQKEYSSCGDKCADTTNSVASCESCCNKNCDNSADGQLCEARCVSPMLNFLQNKCARGSRKGCGCN